MSKSRFALFFGNRGFFPERLVESARQELKTTLEALGHETLLLDPDATRYGAVETPAEGKIYADFLKKNEGKFDGVVLCLPNFGDETGAVSALRDAGVPILIQAYPDRLDEMDFQSRRDAFCGKFSVMDVFCQYGVPFTIFPPHVVHPESAEFARQIDCFDRTCRVVNGMRRFNVGAIGARTTAFKTVRFDELALQKYDITVEALDLSEVFMRVRDVKEKSDVFDAKLRTLRAYTGWDAVPDEAVRMHARVSCVIDDLIAEYELDALGFRCWIEIEKELGIAPCVLLGELNDRGMPAACELDVCNAVAMRALHLASGAAPTCLDWNNNYGDDPDKCILFHCGPVPQSLMTGQGQVIDHPMFAKALGPGCGYGPCVGRIAPTPFTYSSCKTDAGELVFYLGEGTFTEDPIPEEYFGCAGVAEIAGLQDVLAMVGRKGYRHHVSVTPGSLATGMREAFTSYLGYTVE
ncbi:MAG: hypothetical protein KAI66_14530 [Lentisphaeria bacterium]|nr:hypothetical protein [Lentisphaeria bacterium]